MQRELERLFHEGGLCREVAVDWESAAGPAEFTTLGHASDSTLVLLVELSVDHYSPPSSS